MSVDDAVKAVDSVMPKWIPIEERLPEIGDRVLVSERGHIEICNYVVNAVFGKKNGESCFMNEQDEQPDYSIAQFWMPLPPAP
jgi:hypothetical protein